MLFFATMNRKRLYIAPSSFFNQQGTSLHHLLAIIPLLAPPAILMLVTDYGPLALAGGGLLGWALSPVWVRLLAYRLQKCKYHMAVGFRGITEVCRRIAVIERGVIVRDISTAPDTLRELEHYFAVEEM